MPGKRFTVEQIVAKLREAEKLQGQGAEHSGERSPERRAQHLKLPSRRRSARHRC
jgi:hypothetical protein